MSDPTVLDRMRAAGVIATLRAPSAARALAAVDALVAGGITAVEVTYSTPEVPKVLLELRAAYGDRLLLGAGTLTEPWQAADSADAGAEFLVSPGLDDDVVAAMRSTPAVVMAGALTPTEVMRARRLEVDIVKLFPGSLGGPSFVRALQAPFPDLRVVPTGGVSVGNLADWFGAGVFAVGVGGELCPAAAIAAGDWSLIRGNAEAFIEAFRAAG
jgi:2-dehydro-3-deoxyphosphogluconate aldolase/(4S)-4-hydroxy-2-oxoglutarate aldolase